MKYYLSAPVFLFFFFLLRGNCLRSCFLNHSVPKHPWKMSSQTCNTLNCITLNRGESGAPAAHDVQDVNRFWWASSSLQVSLLPDWTHTGLQ